MNIETTKAELIGMIEETHDVALINDVHLRFKRIRDIRQTYPKLEFTPEELEWTDIILNGLSKKLLARYKKLSLKLLREQITEEEREELIGISDEIEQFSVERLRNLIKLSESWQISVPDVMKKLKIKTPPALHA